MSLYDVWASDDAGAPTARIQAPTAEAAARAHALKELLPSGTRVTVRELSGSRERRVFRVEMAVELTAAATEET